MRSDIHSEEHTRLRTTLKRERKKAGLYQTDIAKRTNRSQPYISKFENGDLSLDVISFIQICKAIGCDHHAVLDEVFDK